MTKVLVTGAAGVLGRELVPLIERDGGFALRLTDAVPLETSHEFFRADLARWEEAERLCDGVDEVVHIAAIHPWKPYTPAQYIDCNIKATWNVLQAAANAGVQRVIYTSSVAAMGYKPEFPGQLPFDESKPCRPAEDLYGISKHVGEQFCEMFRAQKGLSYVALRPGCFIPRPDDDPVFGLGLLTLWLHRSDVAAAHFLALKSGVRNEAILVAAKVPFTHADAPALLADAPPVILRYFPAAGLLAARGIQLPKSISPCFNIEKAERLLGYHPAVNFREWVDRVCGT